MAIDLRGRSVSFYDDISLFPNVGSLNTLYVDRDTKQIYAWNGSIYEIFSSDGVPYTGATGNVDLGEFQLKAGQFELDQTPTGTAGVAITRWNDSLGSTETTLKGGSVVLKNGVDLVARVVNKVTPNATLTKAAYRAVRISGAQGQRLAVAYAQANNDNNSADTIGLVCEDIATNQEGFILTVGQLEGINTTGSLQSETWSDGDVLYLSPTIPGAITKVKPTGATGHIVVIGYVEYAHVNNGKIYVKIMNGWELDELHNVYINTGTLANNDALIYESSTQLWKNKTIATALGYTPVTSARNITINGTTQDLSADRTFTVSTGITVGTTPSTGVDTRVFFQAGGVLQQSARFTFDNTTATNILQLGSGANLGVSLRTIAPGATVGDIAFRVRNSADTGNLVYINGIGDVALSSATITSGTGGNGTAIAIGEAATTNTGYNANPITIGKNSTSNGNSIAIGNGASTGTGQANAINNISIGTGATTFSAVTDCIAIGRGTTTGQTASTIAIGAGINFSSYAGGENIALGHFFNGVAFVNRAYAIGSGVSDASRATLGIGDSFSIYIKANERSFFVNKNTNIVMRSQAALSAGTHFEAAATNTLTIHNGTAPVTTIANAGQLYVEAGALRYRDGNGTITNAGGTVQSVASAATVTPVATNKLVKITAQAVGLTLAVPTGTIADGQDLMIRIKDSGSAQAITWTSGAGGYRAIGITLPTTTTAGKTTYVGLVYNSDDSRWDAIGVTTEV